MISFNSIHLGDVSSYTFIFIDILLVIGIFSSNALIGHKSGGVFVCYLVKSLIIWYIFRPDFVLDCGFLIYHGMEVSKLLQPSFFYCAPKLEMINCQKTKLLMYL